jgi:GTPase
LLYDRARIQVSAGKGGDGSLSFRREKYVAFGGPDGGDGGPGGSVYLVASPHLNTLLPFKFKKIFKAENGGQGRKQKQHGKAGEDLVIDVPAGTVVHDAEDPDLSVDLAVPGQKVLVAKGGRGGLGNTHFTTPSHQAPHIAEKGEPGEEREIQLELKLLADVGLIGYPNAGKSTLLSVISAAKPKIADYPFTTLAPNLGVASVEDYSFVAADVPGLIEGAHEGLGLGLQFLRHIERTRVLVHVLDGSGQAGRDPLDDFRSINEELAQYNPDLASRPQIVAVNKMDLPEASEDFPRIREKLTAEGWPVYAISAATGEGVAELLHRVVEVLKGLPLPTPELAPEEVLVLRRPAVDEQIFVITSEPDGAFRVEGSRISRLASMTNFDLPEAADRFDNVLEKTGIREALEAAGAKTGDVVRIGPVELTWTEEFPEPQRRPHPRQRERKK